MTRKSATAFLMSSFSSSRLLVWVQVSVSSSWRLAQTANTDRKAITLARTTNVIGSARRALAAPESVSVSFMGLSRFPSGAVYAGDRSHGAP